MQIKLLDIYIYSLLLIISCKSNQKYSYELADSNGTYIVDSWSADQKKDYYNKSAELIREFLSWEKIDPPAKTTFLTSLKKLNILVDTNNTYQIVPYNIFEQDTLNRLAPQLVIFPKHRIVSFLSELPLLDNENLVHYKSEDFRKIDRSLDYNIILNKLLFTPELYEVDNWLQKEHLDDLFEYLVCSLHFTDNMTVFQNVIKKLQNRKYIEKYNFRYLQLLFKPNEKILDTSFVSKIAALDHEKIIYRRFIKALNSDIKLLSANELNLMRSGIENIYSQKQSLPTAPQIQKFLKKDFKIIDSINGDLDKDSYFDRIYIAASNNEITYLQVLIFRNNNDRFSMWAKNDSIPIFGEMEYKKVSINGNVFTIEYARDIESRYNVFNHLTFLLRNNVFILNNYVQETYDSKLNKTLPIRKMNNKNSRTIKFEEVNENLLSNLIERQ